MKYEARTIKRYYSEPSVFGFGVDFVFMYDQWTWCQVPYSKDVRDKAIAIKENSFWGEVRATYLDKKNMYLLRGDTNHPSFVVYVESVNEIYRKYMK